MLPDFPSIKKDLYEKFRLFINYNYYEGDPLISSMNCIVQHEGNSMTYHTVDGEKRELEYKHFSYKEIFDFDEIKNLNFNKIVDKFSSIIKKMQIDRAKLLFEEIDECVKKTGNIIKCETDSFSFENFIKMLEMIPIDYNEYTQKFDMPTLTMNDEILEKNQNNMQEWMNVPEYKNRFEDIMRKKYNEWYARENNRKLVD